jgi:hypothetical protein
VPQENQGKDNSQIKFGGLLVDLEIVRVAREMKASPLDSRHQSSLSPGIVGRWAPFNADGEVEWDPRKRIQYMPEVNSVVALFVHEPVKAIPSERFSSTNFMSRNDHIAKIVPVEARVLATVGWFADLEYTMSEAITNCIYAGDSPADRSWGWVELPQEGVAI